LPERLGVFVALKRNLRMGKDAEIMDGAASACFATEARRRIAQLRKL